MILTHLKTNISPETWWLVQMYFLLNVPLFRGTNSFVFSGCTSFSLVRIFFGFKESRGRSHHGDFEVGDLLPQRHGALGRDFGQRLWGADGDHHQAELNNQFPSWWFQAFFIFIPIWGRWTQFDDHIFSDGLKPPTSSWLKALVRVSEVIPVDFSVEILKSRKNYNPNKISGEFIWLCFFCF